MLHTTEVLTHQTQAQLDRLLSVQRIGLDCCESAVGICATTTRRLIGQYNSNVEAVCKGQVGDLMVGVGKVFADHWQASVAQALQAQQQLVACLEPLAADAATPRRNANGFSTTGASK